MAKLTIIPTNQKADYAVAGEVINDLRSIEAESLEDKIAKAYAISKLLNDRLLMKDAERKDLASDRTDDLHNRQFGTNFQRRIIESTGFDDTTKTNKDKTDYTEL